MTVQFRPAVRSNVGIIIILSGPSGSGKTFSALRLASGISGEKPFALIDTESGRALHYADQFRFEHGDMKPPFSPMAYAETIATADKAGYPVIVVDSFSHEHAGDGGLLDYHETELQRMAGDDWKKREACKMAAWIKPKSDHKRMVSRLLQVRAHLILCLRAEEKIDIKRGEGGKMEIVKKQVATGLDGWVPICEKNLPYEATASFLLMATKPGFPMPIKLQEQHKGFFPLDRPIDESAGTRIAEWAAGGKPPVAKAQTQEQPSAREVEVQKMVADLYADLSAYENNDEQSIDAFVLNATNGEAETWEQAKVTKGALKKVRDRLNEAKKTVREEAGGDQGGDAQ